MKKPIFTGVATAIVTPFIKDKVDYDSFATLIEWQIQSGINAIVVAGTTGESPTLSDSEHKKIIEFCVEKVNGRIPVIAGTGSNNTTHAIMLTKYACKVGADAILLVCPYYNKPTQQGLLSSYTKIASASTKPCILYNIPSRTGCNILPETIVKLSKHHNIVAIKEASGNISQITKLASLVKNKIDIYSGNDDQILPILSLGGKGVISVLSNILPKQTINICKLFFEGKIEESRKLQLKYLPLINALFCETNPIPIKTALAKMGYCKNYLRLPLVKMQKENAKKLFDLMKKENLID